MQLMGFWREQLEHTLEGLEIDLQVLVGRLIDMLLCFLLRLRMLAYLGYYFLDPVSKFLAFIISLHLLIMHNNHMRLMSRLGHY